MKNMKRTKFFSIGSCLILGFGLTACGSNSSTPPSSSSAASSTSTNVISLSPSPASVAVSESLTLIPSGGTPPYTFTVTNAVGGVSPSSGYSTTYTAPASTGGATLTITDSANNTGSFLISVVAASTTTTTTTTTTSSAACGGTWSIAGIGQAGIVSDDSGNISGFINYNDWNYPIWGTCSISNGTGTISFTDELTGVAYTGALSTGSGGLLQVTAGTYTNSSGNWTATQSEPNATPGGAGAQVCEGSYTVSLSLSSGSTETATLQLIGDEAGNVAGFLNVTTLNGSAEPAYDFPVLGTCSGGAIDLDNLDTGTIYTGTYSVSGTAITLSSGVMTSSGSQIGSFSATGTGTGAGSPVF